MLLSIVIPTFRRQTLLVKCLDAVLAQTKAPDEVIVIDNESSVGTEEFIKEKALAFAEKSIDLKYVKSFINSGAMARNIGMLRAKGELVAFLDDDVILDKNYYSIITQIFKDRPEIVGVQGFDKAFLMAQSKINGFSKDRIIYEFEKFFAISSYYGSRPIVLPSLCVINPPPDLDGETATEWVSTCACVYRRKALGDIRFDERLMKYSWNEYIDFSLRVSRKFPRGLLFTSRAEYFDLQVQVGRLPNKDLLYMAEVYDFYLFNKLFDQTLTNKAHYWKSKVGRLIFNILKAIKNLEGPKAYQHAFCAFFWPIKNRRDLMAGDLSIFNRQIIGIEEEALLKLKNNS